MSYKIHGLVDPPAGKFEWPYRDQAEEFATAYGYGVENVYFHDVTQDQSWHDAIAYAEYFRRNRDKMAREREARISHLASGTRVL